MRLQELRKEYLSAQALSYVSAGLFLISYANAVQLKWFIFGVGMTLSCISLLDIIILTFLPKCVHTAEGIDSYVNILILPITFMAIFLSIPNTRDMGFVELRLLIFIPWSILSVFSMGVRGFKIVSKYIKGNTDTKGYFYKLFVYLSGLTLAMGWFLMLYGFYEPGSIETLINFNRWLYNPMVWFGFTLLQIFPILMLAPKDDNEDESKF